MCSINSPISCVSRSDYHKLFDALCAKKKHELGVPLHRPTSFEDIPAEKRDEFEFAYMAAAREVGSLLLADKKLGQAWIYFHAIRETEPIRAAIEAAPMPREHSDQSEELIDLGFYKLAHPVKGMQVMLKTHGTCSTITSLDQQFQNLSSEQRAACAAILVKSLHGDLLHSIQHEVKQRMPFAPPASTLRELIAGREWLFADNNYHIDVSHLHSTVRFARSLSSANPELKLALDLAEYGSQLSPQFQYAGEPPFTEFYPAHLEFFRFLLGENQDSASGLFSTATRQGTGRPGSGDDRVCDGRSAGSNSPDRKGAAAGREVSGASRSGFRSGVRGTMPTGRTLRRAEADCRGPRRSGHLCRCARAAEVETSFPVWCVESSKAA